MNRIAEGHYYKKQLGCDSATLAWSHRARFKMALGFLEQGDVILDYGCGDGTFLAMASRLIVSGTGVDVAPEQIEDCRERLSALGNLEFYTTGEVNNPALDGKFAKVFCMETLEHCTTDVVERVLDDLYRLVSRDGIVIISVPIETGFSFIVKSIVRKVAAMRGLGDYRYYEPYSLREGLEMVFARKTSSFDRPAYGDAGREYHSHYGFNWRAMREAVSQRFQIEGTYFSPLPSLRGLLSSQAWFKCRARMASRS